MRTKRSLWRALRIACGVAAMALIASHSAAAQSSPRVIEILADHDSRFKLPGQATPVLSLTAGESLVLRITAKKAHTRNRDGSIHGFTLLRVKGHTRVSGWDFLLKPGVQEFKVTAPDEPGEYEAICTVICGGNHEGMTMKVVVLPKVD
ncbi:MAG TPA: hypothetical protein VN661_08600 [Candidatus Acidoferrales bacterium]|nr:hypothetical protein [Candidatus Acidoferrales bacterium]